MFDRALDCFDIVDHDTYQAALPVYTARPSTLPALLDQLPSPHAAYARATDYRAKAGSILLLPGEAGLSGAILGVGTSNDFHVFGTLATDLPAGKWRFADEDADRTSRGALGFALGAYRFSDLKSQHDRRLPRLVLRNHADVNQLFSSARATWLARDLINMPANRLGPAELAQTAAAILTARGAHVNVMFGRELASGYPAMHAVGAGSQRPPHLVSAKWSAGSGSEHHPLISLCGKGVCFDTGGYDIKPSAGMLRMKKDMGGAAIALGLACMIIEAGLPVRLELKLGCVENMISGTAFRPSDVVATRAGLSVEVGNTDAEGRLVLCDLLAEACETKPDMLLDFATLTGAARVALGPDLPALFANDDALATLFTDAGASAHDPVWRLPLWDGYNSWLESGTGDLNNVSEKAHAGAVVAALFLQRFVSAGTHWAHFDVYAWNDTGRPGKPAGGEAQAMRAAFAGVAEFAERWASRVRAA